MGQKISLECTPLELVILSLMILVVPLRWLLGIVLAAVVHELGHVIVLCIFGIPLGGIRIGGGGIFLQVSDMAPWKELVCAAAGPLGSFSTLGLCHIFPETAICGLGQGLFNLLPIFPSDGGRIVQVLVKDLSGQRQKQMNHVVAFMTGGILVCLTVALVFPGYRIYCIMGGIWTMNRLIRNISCKESCLEIQ